MTARPDLAELERLLAEYLEDVDAVEDGGGMDGLDAMIRARAELEDAAAEALPFLLAEARKVETLREALREAEEWIDNPNYRRLEGARDD